MSPGFASPRIAVLVAASLALACARKAPPPPAEAARTLEVGQIWSYKARKGEETSTLAILKIESHPKHGRIVHVALEGVRLEIPRPEGSLTTTISHLPFQEAALRGSLLEMVTRTAEPPDLGGYVGWKQAFDQGKAGIWTMPVAEAVAAVEKMAPAHARP